MRLPIFSMVFRSFQIAQVKMAINTMFTRVRTVNRLDRVTKPNPPFC
jgi:hypothetical protein